tara:strand:- start:58 stop:396 length:339 start_codon:yes stop_codon:yes gene_type:complete
MTLSELEQTLSDNKDYQVLVKSGVMPNDLRWHPQVDRKIEHDRLEDKSVVTISLSFRHFPGAKVISTSARKVTYPHFLSPEDAIREFPDGGWEQKQVAQWKINGLNEIVSKL